MTRRQLILFTVIIIALYSLGIFWGLPSAMTAASDSTAPLGPLAFVADYWDVNKSFIYPAVHQLLLIVFYAVVLIGAKLLGYLHSISGTWPYGFTDPSGVFSALILVSNLVSMAMGITVLLCLRRFRATPTFAAWFSMMLLAFSGVFTYYARVANMDMPYLFWWIVSYLFLWRYMFEEKPRRIWLVYSGITAALAVGTKDQSAGLILGFGLIVLLVSPTEEVKGNAFVARIKNAALFSAALLISYALVAVATNPFRWLKHVIFVTSDHVRPEFEQSVHGQIMLFGNFLDRLNNVLTPGGIALGVAGLIVLIALRKYRETAVLVLPALTYYCSIIAKVRSTEERYLLPIAIILVISAGVAVGSILGSRWGRNRAVYAIAVVVLACILIQQFVLGFVPVTYCQLFDSKQALAKDIPNILPEGEPLLIVDMVSFNYPNRYVYERYSLIHPPGEATRPPSTHGENLFRPYSPNYRYILAGNSQEPGTEAWPKADAKLIREWTYPLWIKRNVHVPAVYEFYLYQRE